MAAMSMEIESFILKFKSLLAHGVKASLLLEAENYESFVTLKAKLGSKCVFPSPLNNNTLNNQTYHAPQYFTHKKPRTPSYYRRQERRKSERQHATLNIHEKNSVTESNEVESAEKAECVNTVCHNEIHDAVNSSEILPAAEANILEGTMNTSELTLAEEVEHQDVEEAIVDEIVNKDVKTEVDTSPTNDVVENGLKEDADKLPPKEETVWATVNLDNSSKSKLNVQDLNGIEGILTRYDHLKQNIVKIDFGHYSTSRTDDGFCHRLDVKLLVDVTRLWEHARPYIWKFLGQQEWRLSDGTLITFNRIHVKT